MSNSEPSQFLEPETTTTIETIRHSCAHVMAHAISNLWPKAKFGIGPVIENGFYYDVDLEKKLSIEDLKVIEREMKRIVGKNSPFIRSEHSIEEAIQYFKDRCQIYKVEVIENLRDFKNAKTVTFYQEGEFTDLCRGPHVKSARSVCAFKLMSIAGAYWKGLEKNPQLQRIYGVCFETKTELDEHLNSIEEAKKRDHRKLGKELDLFSFHEEAPASPFFHPKGTIVYNRLVSFIRSLYAPSDYDEIITPQILDVQLWHKSGHYDNYRDSMYFTEIDERQYAIKPMNCPAATFVYASSKKSYRDLPQRFADFGRLHRYEKSGVTSGLTRVRSFCQDDAHVFCRPDQIEDEIQSISLMILKVYELFGLTDCKIYLSTRPEKRVGSNELWDESENSLRAALDMLGKPYELNVGDGAFYGPKIDFNVKDALNRYHQLSTIQLDFNMPERFGLEYIDSENRPLRPVMIHRAVLGSIERFMGVLIEHVAGVFPFWLAPVQLRIIPVNELHHPYCKDLMKFLLSIGVRAELDDRNESIGLKTREVQIQKIPFSLVVGDREVENQTFSMRKYGERNSQVLSKEQVIQICHELNSEPDKVKNALWT